MIKPVFTRICMIVLLFRLSILPGFTEDYSWWNEIHGWDGVTSWTQYLIISPAYMGPNALPVPQIKKGILTTTGTFELAYEEYFGFGDHTRDLYTKLYLPLFSDHVALDVSLVPIEYYIMDSTTRDLRRARDYDGRGFSAGDFYIGTSIQLFRERTYIPDILISFTLKTASGTNLPGARYTDTPGYYLDFSMSKAFRLLKPFSCTIRPYGLIGFYAWQTYDEKFRQNDAVVYGGGLEVGLKKFVFTGALGGYSGYMENGDTPLVFRTGMQTSNSSFINYKLTFQQGIRDFPYSSLHFSLLFNLDHAIDNYIKSWFDRF